MQEYNKMTDDEKYDFYFNKCTSLESPCGSCLFTREECKDICERAIAIFEKELETLEGV